MGLEALAKMDARQLFRLFVDGRLQRNYRGWQGFEAREPGSVSAMLNGLQYAVEHFEEAGLLTGRHLARVHHACLDNVFTNNPEVTPGDLRIRPVRRQLFYKTTTLESIEEILAMRSGDNTTVFHNGEFVKKAEELNAAQVFQGLQERGSLVFNPWYPPVGRDQLAALAGGRGYATLRKADHGIRRVYVGRIERLLDAFNADINLIPEKSTQLRRICRLIRDLELLHPFQDSSNRIFSITLLNHLLMYHGSPPAMLFDSNLAVGMSYIQWEKEVLKGIENTRTVLTNPDTPLFKFSVNDADDSAHTKFLKMSSGLVDAVKRKLPGERERERERDTPSAKRPTSPVMRLKGIEVVKQLGKGTNGKIYLVQKKRKPASAKVLKHIPKIRNTDAYHNEIAAYHALKDYQEGIKLISEKRYKLQAAMLFEYQYAENIRDYLKREKWLKDAKIFQMVIDILDTITFMADRNILHLDIMASNILYNGTRFYLNDWGDCQAGPKADSLSTKYSSWYMPPELYMGHRDVKSEIYSLGCVVYYVASRRNLEDMYDLPKSTRAQRIFAHVYQEPKFNQHISPNIRRLISHMVQKKPQDRPDISLLRNWIQKDNIPEAPTANSFPEDKVPEGALEIYSQMAEDAVAYGHYKLGVYFENGKFVGKNKAVAIEQYARACRSGFVPAMQSLAKLLKESDKHKAANLIRRVELAKLRAKIG